MTYTYALMEIPPDMWRHIHDKMLAAGYGHAVHEDADGEGHVALDMHGIALIAGAEMERSFVTTKKP